MKKAIRRCSDLIAHDDILDLSRLVIQVHDGILLHKFEIVPDSGRIALVIDVECAETKYKPFYLKRPPLGHLKCRFCDWLQKKFRMAFHQHSIESPQKLTILYYNLIRDEIGVLPQEQQVEDMSMEMTMNLQQRQDNVDYTNFIKIHNHLVDKLGAKLLDYFKCHPQLSNRAFTNPADQVDYFVRW
ncbi:hypothetical protein EON63_04550 [archaeon]|nr:MAG: hypothetical protein EON63_04550 [archaeon]